MRCGHAPKVTQRTSPASASRPSTSRPTKFCLPKCWMLVASAVCGVGVSVSVFVFVSGPVLVVSAGGATLVSAFAMGRSAGPGPPTSGSQEG